MDADLFRCGKARLFHSPSAPLSSSLGQIVPRPFEKFGQLKRIAEWGERGEGDFLGNFHLREVFCLADGLALAVRFQPHEVLRSHAAENTRGISPN